MFTNSSKNGNLAYVIGTANSENYSVLVEPVDWKDLDRVKKLLNTSALALQLIQSNDGRHYAIVFDADARIPKNVIILKFVLEGENKILVDIQENDRIVMGLVMKDFMKLTEDSRITFLDVKSEVRKTLQDESFKKEYNNSINAKARKELFGDDPSNAAAIWNSFKYICQTIKDSEIFGLYIFIVSRLSMGMSLLRTEQSFNNPQYREIDRNTRLRLITFVKMSSVNPSESCTNLIMLRIVDGEINKVLNHAKRIEELSKPDDESFGLSPDNPLLTTSIPNAYEFLDRLVPDSGTLTNRKRIGVVKSIFPDMVDLYEISVSDASGNRIVKIYVDSYAEFDTAKAPKGFTLREYTFEDALKAFGYNKAAFDLKRHK